jgi:hypothetical protein
MLAVRVDDAVPVDAVDAVQAASMTSAAIAAADFSMEQPMLSPCVTPMRCESFR